jgi:hypothetical protein
MSVLLRRNIDASAVAPELAILCMYVCMYVCMYLRRNIDASAVAPELAILFVCTCMNVDMYVCVCVLMCVCMYVCRIDLNDCLVAPQHRCKRCGSGACNPKKLCMYVCMYGCKFNSVESRQVLPSFEFCVYTYLC